MGNKPDVNNLDKEVQIIRQILVGEQLEKLSERFEELEAQVKNLKLENRRLQKQLGDGTAELRKELETEKQAVGVLVSRVDTVAAGLDEHFLAKLDALRKALATYKRTVGGKFTRLEKKTEGRFLQLQTHQDNLVSSLAAALLVVQKGTQEMPVIDK